MIFFPLNQNQEDSTFHVAAVPLGDWPCCAQGDLRSQVYSVPSPFPAACPPWPERSGKQRQEPAVSTRETWGGGAGRSHAGPQGVRAAFQGAMTGSPKHSGTFHHRRPQPDDWHIFDFFISFFRQRSFNSLYSLQNSRKEPSSERIPQLLSRQLTHLHHVCSRKSSVVRVTPGPSLAASPAGRRRRQGRWRAGHE